jgi:predicted NAD-dependent protein-ADP-ribosyltransferase YbiA (DUF1768 family)
MFTNKPLNVFSRSDEDIGRKMSNFTPLGFALDGVEFGSVEAFYVYLLFTDEEKREKVRKLYGHVVKNMGKKSKLTRTCYRGEWFDLGSDRHVALIKRAIRAKLEAHPNVAREFVATRPREIVHDCGHPESPHDVFPAAVFVRILSELREEFTGRLGVNGEGAPATTCSPRF